MASPPEGVLEGERKQWPAELAEEAVVRGSSSPCKLTEGSGSSAYAAPRRAGVPPLQVLQLGEGGGRGAGEHMYSAADSCR